MFFNLSRSQQVLQIVSLDCLDAGLVDQELVLLDSSTEPEF